MMMMMVVGVMMMLMLMMLLLLLLMMMLMNMTTLIELVTAARSLKAEFKLPPANLVMNAARRLGVKRFIHISSISVLPSITGTLNEDALAVEAQWKGIYSRVKAAVDQDGQQQGRSADRLPSMAGAALDHDIARSQDRADSPGEFEHDLPSKHDIDVELDHIAQLDHATRSGQGVGGDRCGEEPFVHHAVALGGQHAEHAVEFGVGQSERSADRVARRPEVDGDTIGALSERDAAGVC